jgi:LL-diaminopimelate aminotransferase
MKPARRLDSLPVYAFASLGARLQALQASGVDVIRLDIGSPDGPPTPLVIETLAASAHDPGKHGYPGFMGLPALRQAMAGYYQRRFGVELNASGEILPLIGSKEGIANMSLAWLDPGDLALVPDPGYPTYRLGAALAGADVYFMPLLEENAFLPDLSIIPPAVADKARIMWLNYPNNPTGGVAPMSYFEEAVSFCRRHDILLCHDVPYADVCYDGYLAPSLLAVPGAKDQAVEFNSLSKSHNMAGWRVGMAVGNERAVGALGQIKTNVDSGMFLAIQEAAIAALTENAGWMAERNKEYEYRRDLFYELFNDDWGVRCHKPKASLYLWPRVPAGYTSAQCAEKVLVETGVSLAPGTTFGPGGEGYLRVSVGQTTERVVEAVRRLRAMRF